MAGKEVAEKAKLKAERSGHGEGELETLTLTVLYVLPQDPVFGIIFKCHKAALLRAADLRQREEQHGGAESPLPPSPGLQKTGRPEAEVYTPDGVWPSGTGG